MCSSKKGFSANQLHRILGVTAKSAWFLGHRFRAAMMEMHMEPMGAEGEFVEADETFKRLTCRSTGGSRAAHCQIGRDVTMLGIVGPASQTHGNWS